MTGLLSLLYSSNASETFDDERLDALLTQSRDNNRERGLTGMLLYRGGRFVQVLEGPEAEVRAVFARIRKDPRHSDLRVLIEEPIAERQFSDWTMGYEPISIPEGVRPEGFRDTFEDLEGDDAGATMRAARELSFWFRVKSARP